MDAAEKNVPTLEDLRAWNTREVVHESSGFQFRIRRLTGAELQAVIGNLGDEHAADDVEGEPETTDPETRAAMVAAMRDGIQRALVEPDVWFEDGDPPNGQIPYHLLAGFERFLWDAIVGLAAGTEDADDEGARFRPSA